MIFEHCRNSYAEPVDYPTTERPGTHDKWEPVWHRRLRKNGAPGKRWDMFGIWYTPLFQCNYCGIWGSPRKVAWRSDVHRSEWIDTTLCVGCWNKVRVVYQRYRELEELKRLVNKLKTVKP